ncbi:MAG TPA: xylulose 5-phosphate 3-epimerase [Armatimonadetes bacterium]|nr:xylulose 5-phosphate 3-epimerase [Armatimonadota bacterium]
MKKATYYGSLPAKLDVRGRLELAKDAGLDGVEIPTFKTQRETEEVASIAAEVGIAVHSVMAGSHWTLPLSSTDEDVRLQGVEGIKHALQVAKWAGADTVLVVPGVVNESVPYGAAYDLSQKSLREILPTAEELGITMAIENVWNKFLLSPLEFRTYIDQMEHELVKAYFDVGNILLYGYPHQWIDILGDRIVKVHIKDFNTDTRNFVALLTGHVDWPRVVNALRGIGYSGYLTAELAAYTHFPEQLVYDTAAHLDKIINS